jgi:hypothetical protein
MDNRKVVLLVMLDMSSAFDTVNHCQLLNRLLSLGIDGDALTWFKGYLTDRCQMVAVNGCLSSTRSVGNGVPQGSVLGPLLFSTYISPLKDLFNKHGVRYHCYADDIQIYISSKPEDAVQALNRLEHCVSDVANWLADNYLALNNDKTEFIVFGTRQMLSKCPPLNFTIGGIMIKPSDVVRNLGVYFDKSMTMERHVNYVTSTSFTHIRLISRIRRSLCESTCKMLVNSLVLSRIDYCGSLYNGISRGLMNKLNMIINAATRVVKQLRKYDSVKLEIKNLGWLPAAEKIKFRTLMLIYKTLHGLSPPYLASLVTRTDSLQLSNGPALRSRSHGDLMVQRCNTSVGQRAFISFAPTLWNGLAPEEREARSITEFMNRVYRILFDSASV